MWLADLGIAAKTRPVIVVSRFDQDPPRALVIYVPLTTANRGSRYEVPMPALPFLRSEGVANVQGVGSVPVTRLEWRLGVLPAATMAEVKSALRFALELE